MNKFAAFGLAGLIVTGLAACSYEDPKPTPTVTVTVSPSPSVDLNPPEPAPSPTEQESPRRPAVSNLTPEQKKQVFLQVIRNEYPQYNDSDTDLLELGALTCQKFTEGATGEQIRGTVDPNASNSGYLSFIIGAAVGTFCPEYSDELLKK